MAKRICKHIGCGCEPDPGLEYCCDYCAQRNHTAEDHRERLACECGHPECRPEHAEQVEPEQFDPRNL